MSQPTAIGWTDISWNPVHGCSIVSTECRNCYAAELSQRYGQTKKPWTPANAAENVTLKPHKLREPLSHAKMWRGLGAAAAAAGKTDGKLVFVNSMSDLFHEQVPDEFIARVFAVMAVARPHTFQVLTKRPERMRDLLNRHTFVADIVDLALDEYGATRAWVTQPSWVFAHVWLGVSIGNHHFNHRAHLLRETTAITRFISAEPLLGPLVPKIAGGFDNPVAWWPDGKDTPCVPYDGIELTDIDWLIVGGESGKHHRPLDPEWVADLRDYCEASDTAFFMKQDAGPRAGSLGRFAESERWPREFPRRTFQVQRLRAGEWPEPELTA